MAEVKKQSGKKNKARFNYKLIPLMVIIGIIPLIVYAHLFTEAVYGGYTWFNAEEYAIDGYLFGKAAAFSVITVLMLIDTITSFILLKKEEKMAFIKKMWPMFVYLLFILLSTIFAMDKDLALHGGYDQMEPVLVLVGYAVLPMYIFLVVKDEKDIRYIGYAGLFSAFAVSLIGILQMAGYDIYMQHWIRPFIFSKEINQMVGKVLPKEMIYSSLGNSNYVGTFVCEMLPVVLMMLIIKNRLWVKVIAVVDTVCLIAVLYGSGSETGMIILAGMIVLAVIFLFGRYLKKWYITVPLLIVFAFFVFFFNKATDSVYLNKVLDKLGTQKKTYILKGIDTTGDCIRILYRGKDLKLSAEYNEPMIKIIIRDESKVLFYEQDYYFDPTDVKINDEDTIRFKAERRLENDYEIRIQLAGKDFGFIYHIDTNEYKILNADNVEDECIIWENALSGHENLATGRGYIWGTSIPKLKDTIFIGAGPDNYPVIMGENGTDYALKWNAYKFSEVFTRPHNYYLQTGINVGCISLLACLIFFILYLVDCCKLFFGKALHDNNKKIGFMCMLAVVGYLGCGIANDSMITVSPIFWTILGMGIVIDELIKRDADHKEYKGKGI